VDTPANDECVNEYLICNFLALNMEQQIMLLDLSFQVPPHLQQSYNYPPATANTPQQPFIHGRHSIGSTARPASSAEQSPYYPFSSAQQRPTSAMSFPHSDTPYLPSTPRQYLQQPASALTTSAKSVFDCDQGCFIEEDDGSSIHSATCPHNPSNNPSISSQESYNRRRETTSQPKDV
jgi:hypothetical protein